MTAERLRVVVADRPPFVFVSNVTGSPLIYGLLIDLFNRILEASGTLTAYELYVAPENAGGTLTEAGWTGVVGELTHGRADVALFPLTRTAARLTAIDCTFSYLDQGIGLAVSVKKHAPGPLSVLAPFSNKLWASLLCTIVSVALIFWMLDMYGDWIRERSAAALRASGHAYAPSSPAMRMRKDDRSVVLTSFIAAAGAPERPGAAHWGVQVLYIFYCFFCVIVLSAYTANLTSYFMVWMTEDAGISGLQDLVDKQALLAVIPNGTNAAYFASSYDPVALQLRDRLRFCDLDTCLGWLRAGAVQAFASNMPQLEYLAKQRPCDVAVARNSFGPGNLVIGLQKNSTLLPLFNAAIQRFLEDGTMSTVRRAWSNDLDQCEGTASLDNASLGVRQLLGAFVLMSAGVVMAFALTTVESFKGWFVGAYARSEDGNGIQEANAERRSGVRRLRPRTLAAMWLKSYLQLREPAVPGPNQGDCGTS